MLNVSLLGKKECDLKISQKSVKFKLPCIFRFKENYEAFLCTFYLTLKTNLNDNKITVLQHDPQNQLTAY